MSKILIVDDNPHIRDNIIEALSYEYEVAGAEDGEVAIALLTKEEFDLVILDLNMPGTNGWEALRIMKDPQNGWPLLKVIILTINNEPENVLKAWNLGASYYMTKPFDMQYLQETIDRALKEEKDGSPV